MRFHPHKKFGGAIFLLPSFVNSEKHSEQTEPRKRARGRQREGDRRYAPVCPAARWAQVGRQTVQYFSKVAVMINISTWKKFKLCQSSKRPKNLECFQKPGSMTEKLRFESFFLQRALTEPAERQGLRQGPAWGKGRETSVPGLPSRSTCRGAQVLRGEAGASCLTDTERHFYTVRWFIQ